MLAGAGAVLVLLRVLEDEEEGEGDSSNALCSRPTCNSQVHTAVCAAAVSLPRRAGFPAFQNLFWSICEISYRMHPLLGAAARRLRPPVNSIDNGADRQGPCCDTFVVAD